MLNTVLIDDVNIGQAESAASVAALTWLLL